MSTGIEKTSRKETWYANGDGKTWNAEKARDEVSFIKQFANMLSNSETAEYAKSVLMKQLFKDPEVYRAAVGAAEEMASIMGNKENVSGCHLNHITSGKTAYCVYTSEDCKGYRPDGKRYTDEEEARAAAAGYEDAYADTMKEGGPWMVYIYDEEATQDAKMLGRFVAEFDTREEAEAEAAEHEDGRVEEFPSEESYIVVDTATGRRVYDIMFPDQTTALAFLYKAAMPPKWEAYLDTRERLAKGN